MRREGGAEECVIYVLKVCQRYDIEGDFVFLGPRETRKPRRGERATERGRRARAAPRARVSRPPRGGRSRRSVARATRLPSSVFRLRRPARSTTPTRGFPEAPGAFARKRVRVRRAKRFATRAARRRDATRAGVTNAARPCAAERVRALGRVERCASTRGSARSRDLTGFFLEVFGVPGEPPLSAVSAPCASERGGGRFVMRRRRYRARATDSLIATVSTLDRASHETVNEQELVHHRWMDEFPLLSRFCSGPSRGSRSRTSVARASGSGGARERRDGAEDPRARVSRLSIELCHVRDARRDVLDAHNSNGS